MAWNQRVGHHSPVARAGQGHPCTPLWCSQGDTSGGGPTTMQCSASSDTDQSNVSHTITCHHRCQNTIMQQWYISPCSNALQQSACSSLSCSAILHLPSVQGLQGEMQWTMIISPTLYLPNNNMSPAVPQWCSSRLSTSRCVPLSADGQVYLGPGSGLQRPPLSTIITSACSGVPAWQQSSASALQHSALGLGHGMMKVRVSAEVSVVVWQPQLFLALNYTFDWKVNDCQISE